MEENERAKEKKRKKKKRKEQLSCEYVFTDNIAKDHYRDQFFFFVNGK